MRVYERDIIEEAMHGILLHFFPSSFYSLHVLNVDACFCPVTTDGCGVFANHPLVG